MNTGHGICNVPMIRRGCDTGITPYIELGFSKSGIAVLASFMSSPALHGVPIQDLTKLETPSGNSPYSRRMHWIETQESGYDTPDSRSRRANLHGVQFFVKAVCYEEGNELMFSAFCALRINVSFHIC
jgi:hypothetical protein